MKVRELIERLQQEDSEAEALGSDCCYGLRAIKTIEKDAVLLGLSDGGRSSVEHLLDCFDGEWYTDCPGPIIPAVVLR